MYMAGNAILKIFFIAIQEGQILDMAFGWQRILKDLYASDKKWKNLLGKAMGDCQLCVSAWFMNVWTIAYYFFSKMVFHYYPTYEVKSIGAKIFVFVIWTLAFHSIGIVMGLSSLIKLKLKNK